MISLKLLAAELLFACPGCKEEHQDDLTSLTQDIYVPGEITETPLSFRRAVRIYASPNNPGAATAVGIWALMGAAHIMPDGNACSLA